MGEGHEHELAREPGSRATRASPASALISLSGRSSARASGGYSTRCVQPASGIRSTGRRPASVHLTLSTEPIDRELEARLPRWWCS